MTQDWWDRLELGPTGQYPEGKLNEEDQGELAIGVVADGGKVIIHFGVPTQWVGMGPRKCKDLAQMLIKSADRALRQSRSRDE
jgi:hypothetical protein